MQSRFRLQVLYCDLKGLECVVCKLVTYTKTKMQTSYKGFLHGLKIIFEGRTDSLKRKEEGRTDSQRD